MPNALGPSRTFTSCISGMRSVASSLALALVLALPALAADAPAVAPQDVRRGMTIEDLYRLARPVALDVSPDGRHLVYALTTRDLPRGRSNTDLYLLATDGGRPRRLTWTEERAEGSPRWSPRGDAVAFIAKGSDGDADQLWVLPMAGGEARQVTRFAAGIADPVWSPDGRTVAVVSRVYPQCGADDACNRRRLEARRDGPLHVHVADELLYRHWTTWADGRVSHVLLVDVESGAIRDATPGDRDAPVFSLGGHDVAFTPDGRELVYTRNPDPLDELALSTNSDVWAVPAGAPAPVSAEGKGQGSRAVNLTADNPGWDARPRVSPADAGVVAWLQMATPGYEADLARVVVLDRKTGARRVLGESLADGVTDLAWLPDGSGLVATIPRRGTTPLVRIDARTGAVADVADFGDIEEFVVSPRGDAAFAVRSRVGEPHEIWRVPLDGSGAPRRLTFHNQALELEVDFRPAESLWVDGPDGQKIQVFVVKPHGFDPARRYPLILNVHGGPQMMWSDRFRSDWQVYPGAGYVVAFPNPTGSTGYGHEYTAAISRDWGGQVFEELDAVADALAELPYVDEQRMGAMGWSWGGYAMAWLLGHTTRYKAIASMMGLYDLSSFWGATEELWFPEWDLGGTPWESPDYAEFNPARFARRFRTPTLVITGERDYRVPYTQSLQLFTALRRQKVPARLIVLTESGHWPGWYDMALYYTAHLEWFARWLGGGGPPWSTDDFAANLVFDRKTGRRIDRPELPARAPEAAKPAAP